MSRFSDLVKVSDDIVISTFGDLLRWTKAGGGTVDLHGIVDMETELWGPDGEIAYLGKSVTVKASDMPTHSRSDRISVLDAETGEVLQTFNLQKTLSNDDGLRIIEITT